MPVTMSMLPHLLEAASKEGDASFQAGSESALKKYLQQQEPIIAGQKQAAQNKANLETLTSPGLTKYLRPGGSGGVGDIKISREPAATGPILTPAQDTAEKTAGKKIAEFEGGGRSAGESNLAQMQGVQADLSSGKRDKWDQIVGGVTENHPTLMSFLAPTEKARRDNIQNAMLSMLHDAGIPRPTQWDIQRVFGQVYDPAADDKTNMARVQNAVTKMAGHQQAVQGQADLYHKTGYATIGGQPTPPQAPPQQAPQSPPPGMSFEQYKAWKSGRGK